MSELKIYKYFLLIIVFLVFCKEPENRPAVINYNEKLKVPVYRGCTEFLEKKSSFLSSLVWQSKCVIDERFRNDNVLEFYKKYFFSIKYRLIENNDWDNFYDRILDRGISNKLIKFESPDGNIFVMIGLFKYSNELDRQQLYIHIGPNYFDLSQLNGCKSIKDFDGDIYVEYLKHISSGEKLKAVSILMPYLICKQDKFSIQLYCEILKEYIGFEEEIWAKADYKKYCQ